MKRFTTLLLLSLLLTTTAFANPIDPKKANEIATTFWNKNIKKQIDGALELIPRAEMSKAGSRFATSKTDPGFYIFTPENQNGFVIISGDDALLPIIGYSETAKADEMPPALCDLLCAYDIYVEDVRNGIIEPMQPTTFASGINV